MKKVFLLIAPLLLSSCVNPWAKLTTNVEALGEKEVAKYIRKGLVDEGIEEDKIISVNANYLKKSYEYSKEYQSCKFDADAYYELDNSFFWKHYFADVSFSNEDNSVITIKCKEVK